MCFQLDIFFDSEFIVPGLFYAQFPSLIDPGVREFLMCVIWESKCRTRKSLVERFVRLGERG